MVKQEWKEIIKQQGLHQRSDKELAAMLTSHEAKKQDIDEALYWITKYPDYRRKQLEEQGLTAIDIEAQVLSETNSYKSKSAKLDLLVGAIKEKLKTKSRS